MLVNGTVEVLISAACRPVTCFWLTTWLWLIVSTVGPTLESIMRFRLLICLVSRVETLLALLVRLSVCRLGCGPVTVMKRCPYR